MTSTRGLLGGTRVSRWSVSAPTILLVIAFIVLTSLTLAASTFGFHNNANAAPLADQTALTFTSSAGTAGKYHIFASGLDSTKPIGALLQFHGDGGGEYKSPDSSWSMGGANGIIAAGKAHNLVVIPMQTPDTATMTWWREGKANAAYVAEFLQSVVYNELGINKNRIWLVGHSGGANFITQEAIPTFGSQIAGGGAIVFGGGGAPYGKSGTLPSNLALTFPMHWCTGTKDIAANSDEGYDALSYAKKGEAAYRSAGFRTSIESPDRDHDLGGLFGPVVAQQLAVQDSGLSTQATKASINVTYLSNRRIHVTGSGFPPNAPVVCKLLAPGAQTKAVRSTNNGTIVIELDVPPGVAGTFRVLAQS